MEEWRTVEEFPEYEISNSGDVRHKETKECLERLGGEYGESYFVRFPARRSRRSVCLLGAKAWAVERPKSRDGRPVPWSRLTATNHPEAEQPYVLHVRGINAAATEASKAHAAAGLEPEVYIGGDNILGSRWGKLPKEIRENQKKTRVRNRAILKGIKEKS